MTAVVSVITVVAVALAAIQVRHVNRQMHREFEMEYLLRFWQLMDRRSSRLKAGGKPSRDDRLILGDYLTLCEDQIELRALGRVTDHTWSYWRRDIRGMCSSNPVARELGRSDPQSFPHLRILMVTHEYDPLVRSRAWRLWNGL